MTQVTKVTDGVGGWVRPNKGAGQGMARGHWLKFHESKQKVFCGDNERPVPLAEILLLAGGGVRLQAPLLRLADSEDIFMSCHPQYTLYSYKMDSGKFCLNFSDSVIHHVSLLKPSLSKFCTNLVMP